jgi:hypothetical protein
MKTESLIFMLTTFAIIATITITLFIKVLRTNKNSDDKSFSDEL